MQGIDNNSTVEGLQIFISEILNDFRLTFFQQEDVCSELQMRQQPQSAAGTIPQPVSCANVLLVVSA